MSKQVNGQVLVNSPEIKGEVAVVPVKPAELVVVKPTRFEILRKVARRHAKGTLPFRVSTEKGAAKGSIQGVPEGPLTVESVRKLAETVPASISLPKGEVINVDGLETQGDEKYAIPAGALLPFISDLREELKKAFGQ